VRWLVNKLDSSTSNSSIEIAHSSKTKQDDMFPLSVEFKVDKTFFRVGVSSATGGDGSSTSYEVVSSLSSEGWKIV